ncbi:HipA domain-containing protein [Thiomicrorhabdus aquaedulcis]|uniref:HipA domain-containing protein n=1 Tax=Thiomicrorhabdus aquaedulcis TaxID=2211106 RepID=UPI001E5BD997|nr:HipA domain-containing protein [Thiomicrorhabdus aquaedulcis]
MVKVGLGKLTKFALIKEEAALVLFTVDEFGQILPIANWYAQFGGRTLIVHQHGGCNEFDGLPFFVYDLIPSGFLGSLELAELQKHDAHLNQDSRNWSAQQIMHYLTHYGIDLAGSFVVGKPAALEAQQLNFKPIKKSEYCAIALEVAKHSNRGSSIGGEQPKFTIFDGQKHKIVKYSPKLTHTNAIAQRHRDLMVCEYLALQTFARFGVLASVVELYIEDRFYLEIERFDRVGQFGRRHITCLRVLDAEYAGVGGDWIDVTQVLLSQELMLAEDFFNVQVVYAFGKFIANTDMHNGNLAFFLDPLTFKPTGLAPFYDVLPMHYMPKQGEIVQESYVVPRLINVNPKARQKANSLTQAFFTEVKNNTLISTAFKDELLSINTASLTQVD